MVGVGVKRSFAKVSGDNGAPSDDGSSAKSGIPGPSGQRGLRPPNLGIGNENMGGNTENNWNGGSDQHNELPRVGFADGLNIFNPFLFLVLSIPPQQLASLACPNGSTDSWNQPRYNYGKQHKQRGHNAGLGVTKTRQPGNGRAFGKLRGMEPRNSHPGQATTEGFRWHDSVSATSSLPE